jgi:thiosulfate dehydrogenase
VLADVVRGGRIYDRWWTAVGAPTPAGDHPLYPEIGQQAGSTTFRCKECHGWDDKGVDGVYGSGSRYTGIAGIYGTTLAPQEVFNLLKADPQEAANGHNMDAYGMSDGDIWDAVKFVFEGVVDTDEFITQAGTFPGDALFGQFTYDGTNCWECHGNDGKEINFGTQASPSYVGTVADINPWEFLHKVRFGHPGAPMPASELIGWNDETLIDLGAYAQTLPVN